MKGALWRQKNQKQREMIILKQSQNRNTQEGRPSGLFGSYVCCKTSKNSKGDPLKAKKIENSHSASKNWKREPFSLVRFRKCSRKFLAKARTRNRDHWVKLITVSRLKSVLNSGTRSEVCGLTKKKTSHCNSRALFTRKTRTKNTFGIIHWKQRLIETAWKQHL